MGKSGIAYCYCHCYNVTFTFRVAREYPVDLNHWELRQVRTRSHVHTAVHVLRRIQELAYGQTQWLHGECVGLDSLFGLPSQAAVFFIFGISCRYANPR